MRLSSIAVAALLLGVGSLSGCDSADALDMASCEKPANARAGIEACTRVIESGQASDTQIADALMFRGTSRQWAGQSEAAVEDLTLALKYRPGHAMTLAYRAGIYGMQERYDEGLRDAEQVLKDDPDHVIALGNRGILREKSGDLEGARKDMDRLAVLDPGNYQPFAERCWIGAMLADKLAESGKDCDKAIEMQPRDPNNFNNRGFHHYRLGDYAAAIADYDRAIEGNPRVGSSFYMRGIAKRALGVDGVDADVAEGLSLEPGVADRYATYGVKATLP